jgi:S-adenosylmethionine synthetase
MCGHALPAVARYLADRLVETARNRLAELELEYGIAKSKVDSIRSKLFGTLKC